MRGDLNLARRFEDVHVQESVGRALAGGQQTMVAQDQILLLAQVGLQARDLVAPQSQAFVVMVGHVVHHKGGLLADGQQAGFQRADRHTRFGVGVHHAMRIVPYRVDGAVDGEAGGVHREFRGQEFVAVHVDFHQAGRGDFIEHQTVGVDQELRLAARDAVGQAQADVGEHQIAPAVHGHQAVGGGELAAQRPFFFAHQFFHGRDVHLGLRVF